jgi:hypothetical protein
LIEIRGENKRRRVTYVMGSVGNWHVTFKGQGAVPEGLVEWRVIEGAQPGESVSAATPASPPPPEPALPQKSKGRFQALKLTLEIVAALLAIIGSVIAIIWGFK